jgi:uncharacterized OB-fold protein
MNQALQPNVAEGRLQYQCCGSCGHAWYFQRDFCPACGHMQPLMRAAEGAGTLHASTLVYRAPSEEFKSLLPYSIVLVDMREGFRVMGHAEPGLALDTPVRCEMRAIAGRLLPFFVKDPDAA